MEPTGDSPTIPLPKDTQPQAEPGSAGPASAPMSMPPGYAAYPPPGYPPMTMPPGYPPAYPPHPAAPPGHAGYGPPPAMPPGYEHYSYPQGYPAQYPGQHPSYPGQPAGYPYPHYPSWPQGQMPPMTPPVPAPVPVATPVSEAVPAVVPMAVPTPPAQASAPMVATAPPAAKPQPQSSAPTVQPAPASAPAAVPLKQSPAIENPQSAEAPKQSRLGKLWRSVGGGSLTFSLLLHVGLILLAGLVVFTSTLVEKNVDFLPGGGTQQGQQASENLAKQVQQRRQQSISKLQPMRRVVSQGCTAVITLPDIPVEILDLPSSDSFLKTGTMSGSGFSSMGQGSGFGPGMGMGATKGFVGMTLFGKLGGDGLPGVFFDLKQTPERQPTPLTAEASEAQFAEVINALAGKKFSETMMKDYYHSTRKMSFTYLVVPYMAATEGPKAFEMEKEVQPRAWFVHYGGTIQAPAPGEYRFVGMFDDALIVYINNKPVLDGSWYSIVDHGEKRKEDDIRQDFGGPVMPGSGRRMYAGKWVRMEGTTRIDIVVGERPGGRVGGILMVQAKKGKYQTRADGTPILPLFSLMQPGPGDVQRMRDFSGSDNAFEIARETPLFTIKKSVFEKD